MKYVAIALFALTGCAGRVVVQDRVQVVNVPVSAPCVSGERPTPVLALNVQYLDWVTYTPKQKAELAAAHALALRSYSEGVAAVTSGCK